MAAIYRDLAADNDRARQITADVVAALARGRHCLILTQWVAHLRKLTETLQEAGHDPVVLRGGMGARSRDAAIARLTRSSPWRRAHIGLDQAEQLQLMTT
jgi:hypothetical protein